MDVVKANGVREAFDVSKLRASLINSGASDTDTEKVVSHIEAELHESMSTGEIYKHAFEYLKELNVHTAHSYSLRRAVMKLGPTGFPFEKLVAEIYKERGYEAVVDQVVMGKCVPHEVDVVAWNDDELIMMEAKYHNEQGTKSDLKVILGVKARWDDLKHGEFDYGNKTRKLTRGVLITNTKFSSTAIQYGKCEDLDMIGWNYPEKGNLQEMIEASPVLLQLIFNKAQ
ncbi:restriction endonuclease [Candidatus Parcubacteria bacterium]|nr:restriction endonuclease [Candidatus Parcubacteria bacterium]